MAVNKKRLEGEMKGMATSPPTYCSGGPINPNDLSHWRATIEGPKGSPYEGGKFKFDIRFSDLYPFKPPVVKCLTRVFHPNINKEGDICIDILKTNWSPALKTADIMLSICSLLIDPNPDDPLTPEAANLYKKDINSYNKKVIEWTKQYAIDTTTDISDPPPLIRSSDDDDDDDDDDDY